MCQFYFLNKINNKKEYIQFYVKRQFSAMNKMYKSIIIIIIIVIVIVFCCCLFITV